MLRRYFLLLLFSCVCFLATAFANDTIQVVKDSVMVSGEEVVNEARKYMGLPYRWGMMNPKKGFDCSGLVHYVFKQLNITLTRNSRAQYQEGEEVASRKELRVGDLVFFTGVNSRTSIGHVGIVTDVNTDTGEFKFIHAGRYGVRINSSSDGHYNRRYVGARRILTPQDSCPSSSDKGCIR